MFLCFVPETGLCEDYEVPYFDMLPSDPTLEDVKKIVVVEKMRPGIPNRWYRDEVSIKPVTKGGLRMILKPSI